MSWKRRRPVWLIDPSKVAFGSVIQDRSRNLSRSHVRVKYNRESSARFVALDAFVQRCHEYIGRGLSLDIEDLLVAPILKRSHGRFFDLLTDWGPATRRAGKPRPDLRPPAIPPWC